MIRSRQLGIEREIARAVCAAVETDDNIHPAARNIFIDGLTNTRLKLGQVARQIDHNVALLPVHGIELDAEFCTVENGLAAAITGHASHTWLEKFIAEKRPTFNAQPSTSNSERSSDRSTMW